MDREYNFSFSIPSLISTQTTNSTNQPFILSIGYEKRKTDSFLDTLKNHKIQAVVDVRQSAFSMRPDFRKYKLISLLKDNEIEYFHLRSAGNPHRNSTNDLKKCLELYYDYISNESSLIEEIASDLNRISRTYPRIAMLCYEKCPTECHRTILINVLKANHFRCSVFEI
jgi:uncharacterized protein (DUF488 family)